jgi:hypothetical protein
MESANVKQFLDALQEMKAIYPFDDEKTILCTRDLATLSHNSLSIRTKDEYTGIFIEMSKDLRLER